MPTLANIVVKKADGVTNVTYTAISPAGGTDPAVLRDTSTEGVQSCQAELRISASEALKGAGRQVRGTYRFPYPVTDSTTTVRAPVSFASASFSFQYDKGMTQTAINEAAYQFGNLLAAQLVKDCMAQGASLT